MSLDKTELVALLEDATKNWLAHDGAWFLSVEERYGHQAAVELDAEAWRKFAAVEAKRVMERRGLKPGGGLEALADALAGRMYALLNTYSIERVGDRTLRFEMRTCRVQAARARKGLPPFHCQPVGEVEFETFAHTVDPRIEVRCVACPPQSEGKGFACAWEFTL